MPLWSLGSETALRVFSFVGLDQKNPAAGGAWEAQSGQHLTLDCGSGRDLTVHGFEPRVRLCANSSEPGIGFGFCVSLSLSLSLCPSPAHALSLCLSGSVSVSLSLCLKNK